jgi:hypothetical protein
MSARLIKIFVVISLVHIVFFSVVLIGFPIPLARPNAEFFYVGGGVDGGEALPLVAGQDIMSAQKVSFDHFDATSFKPWVKLRALNKPR